MGIQIVNVDEARTTINLLLIKVMTTCCTLYMHSIFCTKLTPTTFVINR